MQLTTLVITMLTASSSLVSGFSPAPRVTGTPKISTALEASDIATEMEVDRQYILTAATMYLDESDVDLSQANALLKGLETESHFIESRLEDLQAMAFSLSQRPRLSTVDISGSGPDLLTDIDSLCLENTADFCASEMDNCTLEDRQALVNRLEEQSIAWNCRLKEALSLRKRLSAQVGSTTDVEFPAEVESLMESIQAALHMDYHELATKQVPTNASD